MDVLLDSMISGIPMISMASTWVLVRSNLNIHKLSVG